MTGREPLEAQKKDVLSEKPGFLDKTADVLRKALGTPERATETLAATIMSTLELYHESILNPEKPWNKALYLTTQPENMPKLPTDPVLAWAVDHIGDIWEISAGHTALRMGFVAVNAALKTEKIKSVQKKIFENDKVQNITRKVVGDEKTQELSEGEEIQISDDACFWTSLGTTFTIKAIHSMGWISLFGIHDHMDEPVPGMIFGQLVAASALVATHYAAKHHESIKDFTVKIGQNTLSRAKLAAQKVKEFGDMMESKRQYFANRVENALDKLEKWEPPTAESIIHDFVRSRITKAEKNLAMEHKRNKISNHKED